MLFKKVDLENRVQDIRIRGKRITDIAPDLIAEEGEEVIYANGGALLPGLHDHHIHMNATAASLNSLSCGPPEVSTEQELANALHKSATHQPQQWLRGVGYYPFKGNEESNIIDRDWLDKNGPDCPIRIQHRSGRLWVFNTKGLDALNKAGVSLDDNILDKGHIYDADASVHEALMSDPQNLSDLINLLLSYGITGVTEVTPRNVPEDFLNYQKHSAPLRMTIMGRPSLCDATDKSTDRVSIGHVKLHYHDHDLPSLEMLTQEIEEAHAQGRGVASHCVTHAELMLTLAAIEAAGPSKKDRIEHAAIVTQDALDWIKQLNIGVVTQPNFIVAREQAYRQDIDKDMHPNLWRLGSFQKKGIPLAAGSDAPFGSFNPWQAIHAATHRPAIFDDGEALSPENALRLYTTEATDMRIQRNIKIGTVADLCLMHQSRNALFKNPIKAKVHMTLIDGKIVYKS